MSLSPQAQPLSLTVTSDGFEYAKKGPTGVLSVSAYFQEGYEGRARRTACLDLFRMGVWRRAMGIDDGAIDQLIGACVERTRGTWFIHGRPESDFLSLTLSVIPEFHFGDRRDPDLDRVRGLVEIRLLNIVAELQ